MRLESITGSEWWLQAGAVGMLSLLMISCKTMQKSAQMSAEQASIAMDESATERQRITVKWWGNVPSVSHSEDAPIPKGWQTDTTRNTGEWSALIPTEGDNAQEVATGGYSIEWEGQAHSLQKESSTREVVMTSERPHEYALNSFSLVLFGLMLTLIILALVRWRSTNDKWKIKLF